MDADFQQLKELLPILLPLIVLNLILLIVSFRDLISRPASRVRGGNKVVWGLVIVLVNTIGPIIYLVGGRKD